jgi:hypothetical protein
MASTDGWLKFTAARHKRRERKAQEAEGLKKFSVDWRSGSGAPSGQGRRRGAADPADEPRGDIASGAGQGNPNPEHVPAIGERDQLHLPVIGTGAGNLYAADPPRILLIVGSPRSELLAYVVDDDDRTRRANLLLWNVTVCTLVVGLVVVTVTLLAPGPRWYTGAGGTVAAFLWLVRGRRRQAS